MLCIHSGTQVMPSSNLQLKKLRLCLVWFYKWFQTFTVHGPLRIIWWSAKRKILIFKGKQFTSVNLVDHQWSAEQTLGIASLHLFHMRHFGTQYCDKKCNKKIILRHILILTTKVRSLKNIPWLVFCLCALIYFFVKSLPWSIDIHCSKIYLFCNNCAPKYFVWIRPH